MPSGSDAPARIEFGHGGSAANVAAWAAVGEPFSSDPPVLAGRIGADERGRAAEAELRATGVDTRLAVDPEQPTGTCVVLVAPDGERSMVPDPGANDRLAGGDLPDEVLVRGAHLHLTGYSLVRGGSRRAARSAIARARERGMTVSVDPSSGGAPVAGVPGRAGGSGDPAAEPRGSGCAERGRGRGARRAGVWHAVCRRWWSPWGPVGRCGRMGARSAARRRGRRRKAGMRGVMAPAWFSTPRAPATPSPPVSSLLAFPAPVRRRRSRRAAGWPLLRFAPAGRARPSRDSRGLRNGMVRAASSVPYDGGVFLDEVEAPFIAGPGPGDRARRRRRWPEPQLAPGPSRAYRDLHEERSRPRERTGPPGRRRSRAGARGAADWSREREADGAAPPGHVRRPSV